MAETQRWTARSAGRPGHDHEDDSSPCPRRRRPSPADLRRAGRGDRRADAPMPAAPRRPGTGASHPDEGLRERKRRLTRQTDLRRRHDDVRHPRLRQRHGGRGRRPRRRLGEDDLQLLPDQGVAGPRHRRRGDRAGGPCAARAPSRRVADRGRGAGAQGGHGGASTRLPDELVAFLPTFGDDDRLDARRCGRRGWSSTTGWPRWPATSSPRRPRSIRATPSRRSPAAPGRAGARWRSNHAVRHIQRRPARRRRCADAVDARPRPRRAPAGDRAVVVQPAGPRRARPRTRRWRRPRPPRRRGRRWSRRCARPAPPGHEVRREARAAGDSREAQRAAREVHRRRTRPCARCAARPGDSGRK